MAKKLKQVNDRKSSDYFYVSSASPNLLPLVANILHFRSEIRVLCNKSGRSRILRSGFGNLELKMRKLLLRLHAARIGYRGLSDFTESVFGFLQFSWVCKRLLQPRDPVNSKILDLKVTPGWTNSLLKAIYRAEFSE